MGVYHSAFGLSLLLLLPAAGGAGCSSFNREWRAAESTVAPTASPVGLWTGSWQSTANGHRGELRAATHESKRDYGTFTLSRPPGEP